jgi:NADH-quinone oxidoreductase subunit L
MVTAGIYLIARMSFLFQVTADTNHLIAIMGGCTALMAALIATSQRDIKKVLAYSTVSQLGLMFLALGCKAYFAAIFHVVTHAFFKALLFLGAGSVIHALEGEQDINHMGGLRKSLPWTFKTFAIATFAICGIPPLSGFFSKDTLLYDSLVGGGSTLWMLGLATSTLTAFYMTRLFVLVFFGNYRGHHHPHESPAVMTIPLCLLAVGSALAGFLGVPEGLHLMPNLMNHFLSSVLPEGKLGEASISEHAAMFYATGLGLLAIGTAFYFYLVPERALAVGRPLLPLRTVFENKFWVDELYGILFVGPFERISSFLSGTFDKRVVDAILVFPSTVCRVGGLALSLFQWGSIQAYLLVMLLGLLGVFWFGLKGI